MRQDINNWFISPNGENTEYVTDFFSEIIAQLIDNSSNRSQEELVPLLREDFSFINELEEPHDLAQILQKLSTIYDNSMNASSVGYIGQMDSIPNIGAIVGDLITASINNNMLANEMSPFLTWLEQELIQVFCRWFGFDKRAGGVMTSGGTLANIQALLVARNIKLNSKDGNVYNSSKQPVFFASEHCHSSILKAGMFLGIGTENVIKVKTDNRGKISIDCLRSDIDRSLQEGKMPFAIVSTFGTTNSGSLDEVDEIQSICNQYHLWHHIDAVYGGAMTLSENQKHICPSFEHADSVSFNPQKWMFVSKTCSILIFKNNKQFQNSFRIAAPYTSETNAINLGEFGIQGSRHTSVLKLWLSVYLIGKKSFGKIIDLNMKITKSFTAFVLQNEHLELYTKPELNILLFRPKKRVGQSEKEYKKSLSDFQNYLYHKYIYISLIPWKNEMWLKCIFLNPYFDDNELKKLKEIIEAYFE
ncbi:pyridoxal phosphate-dependent decarboxylase family protein [Aquimarina algicola]|uniref:Aspartate aminotransferase family protein n=1 Tax=Aquimarina algicola TaxID=2589995 RepID=A0A504JPP0_9FLAO|nr:pyridoxal-dependent decarboxylase [Aquimarina algicola]TPN88759.1 aspartate aminotransferase family protein [Aquimarina algicola]